MENKVHLYRCHFAYDEYQNGETIQKEKVKTEYCLGIDGNYYDMYTLKKYPINSENVLIGEQYIIMAEKIDENKFNEDVRRKLDHQKQRLLSEIFSKPKKNNNINDFLEDLPKVDLVMYCIGEVVPYNDGFGILPDTGKIGVAVLYNGEYYELGTAKKITTYKEAMPGEEVAYNFISVGLEDVSDAEYRNLLFNASITIAMLKKQKGISDITFKLR